MRRCVRLFAAWFVRYGLPFRLPVVAGGCRCVFAVRPGGFFFGGGCRRGRFDRWQGGIKMERVGKGLQNGLEQVCRVGVGVFFFWAFIER